MNYKFSSPLLIALIASACLAACGGGDLPPGSGSPAAIPAPASTVSLTPSPELPPGQTAIDASSCFNPAIYVEGASIAITTKATFGATDTVQIKTDTTMGGSVTYLGIQVKQLTEVQTSMPDAPVSASGQITKTTVATRYLTADATAKNTRDYGFSSKSTPLDPSVGATVVDTTYTPFMETRYALQFGRSFQQTFTDDSKITNPDGTKTSSAKSVVKTILYAGIEDVKVAAGTFKACKFQESGTTSDLTTSTQSVIPMKTIWYGVKNGLILKSMMDTPVGKSYRTDTVELQSASINGVVVKP